MAAWQLILAFASPVAAIATAVGALFWGKQVVAAKDAQIDLLKQMSAAEVLPQIRAMKELHELQLEGERSKLEAATGRAREQLEAHIAELQDQVEALGRASEAVSDAYRRLAAGEPVRVGTVLRDYGAGRRVMLVTTGHEAIATVVPPADKK